MAQRSNIKYYPNGFKSCHPDNRASLLCGALFIFPLLFYLAIILHNGMTMEDLFKQADHALYEAKKQKNAFKFADKV